MSENSFTNFNSRGPQKSIEISAKVSTSTVLEDRARLACKLN